MARATEALVPAASATVAASALVELHLVTRRFAGTRDVIALDAVSLSIPHGEMVAIRRCLMQHGSRSLKGATLYTSGEPCAMCMGAILWCHIGRLVFAASVQQLASKIDQVMLSSADVAATARFAPISITGGVLADMAMQLFDKR